MSNFAYLFGLNYPGTSASLRGCINDAKMMHTYLQQKGFQCETHTDQFGLLDTGRNKILEVLNKAVAQTHIGPGSKTIWIHFSGHGSYMTDRDTSIVKRRGRRYRVKEERDGKDECLVPSDYEKSGIIVDDDINDIIMKARHDAKIVLVFDCCHSGTAADLPYYWSRRWRGYKIGRMEDKPKCKVVSISGCEDRQTSADAYNVLGDGKYVGALSAVLLQTMRDSPHLLNDIRKILKVVRMKLKNKGFSQRPVLCSSYNIYHDLSLL